VNSSVAPSSGAGPGLRNGNVIIHIPDELLPEKLRKGGEVKSQEELDALIQVMLGIAYVLRLQHREKRKLTQWHDTLLRFFRDPLKHSRKIAQESTEEWGDYGHQNDRGIINQINEYFWASLYSKMSDGSLFEPNEGTFYFYNPETGLFEDKSVDEV
jgi:hypothetical protein